MNKTEALANELLDLNSELRKELLRSLTDQSLLNEFHIFTEYNYDKWKFIKENNYDKGDIENLYEVFSIRKRMIEKCFEWMKDNKIETVLSISNHLPHDMQLDILQNQ